MSDAFPWPVHPAANRLRLLDDEELRLLATDIAEHGLHEPVWLYDDPNRGVVLLDGRNRARACALVGVDVTEHVRWYTGTRPWAFVLSEGCRRRHLTAGEAVAYVVGAKAELEAEREADDLRRQAEEDARRRKAEARRNVGDAARAAAAADADADEGGDAETITRECTSAHSCDPQPEPESKRPEPKLKPSQPKAKKPAKRRAADDIAEIAGVSGRSVAQFLRVQEQAPDLVKAIESGEMSLAEAEKEIRRRKKAAKVAQIAAAPVAELPQDVTFPVILADPPWRYDYAEDTTRQIENHYPTMPLDEIAALEVPAADDAVLFMWTTSPKLREAFTVLDGWGFTYRTCMVWVKDKIGMGYYARQQHELVVIATRGQLPVPDPADRPSSVFHGPRTEHSAKPVVLHELIERMYPQYRKVEMFARTARPGWSAWGNQAPSEGAA